MYYIGRGFCCAQTRVRIGSQRLAQRQWDQGDYELTGRRLVEHVYSRIQGQRPPGCPVLSLYESRDRETGYPDSVLLHPGISPRSYRAHSPHNEV